MTFIIETVGALILFARWSGGMGAPTALWHAVFHSISAFCNAGFSLNANSLISYQSDWIVIGTISVLVILGGMGFPVILDLIRSKFWRFRARQSLSLHLHTKLMLVTTLTLVLGGALGFAWIEWDNLLEHQSWSHKILVPFFQSVTCRTAGFNSVPQTELTNASLALSMLLMLIGGGSCSTAGGMKVTTAALICLSTVNQFRGRSQTSVFRRTLPKEAFEKAAVLALFYLATVGISGIILLLIEQQDVPSNVGGALFLPAIFEAVSALGTIGLSMDYTDDVSITGRNVLIVLMFVGRLGPVSVFSALSIPTKERSVRFVSEEPILG